LAEIEEEPKVKVKKARKPRTAAKKATAPTPTLHLKEAPSAAPKPVVNPLDALAAKRYELVDAAAKTHNQAKIAAEALDNFDVELASITDRFLEGAVPDTTDIPEAGEEFFKKAKLVTPKKAVIAKKSNGGDAVATVVAVIRSHDGPLAVSALVNTVSNTPLFNPNGSRSQAAIERQVQECLKTLRKSKKVIMSRPKGGESHWALT
jgi:hypothetical protein